MIHFDEGDTVVASSFSRSWNPRMPVSSFPVRVEKARGSGCRDGCELCIKSSQALAIVRPNLVTEAFQDLRSCLDDETDEPLSDFLSYVEAPWIGVVQRGRQRRPLCSISLRKVNTRVGKDPRRNNSIKNGIILSVFVLQSPTRRSVDCPRSECKSKCLSDWKYS